ncbi:MAG: ThiF family adenylyltransferase [Bacteroidia bacterium]|nr:ThiF family adenylyltransferase [Bacteroidia bacterium]
MKQIISIDPLSRYNPLEKAGWSLELLKNASVLVVGAGALGNEVLKNLALLSVGKIFIADFDIVKHVNLSKSVLFRESDCDGTRHKATVAAERLQEINPAVRIQPILGDISIDVGLGLIRRMDIVIGCLDNLLARLAINRLCFKMNKPWVDGAIENLAGQLNVFSPEGECYECRLTDSEWAHLHRRIGCPDIAIQNISQGRIPTSPLSASVIGALQVIEALKLIGSPKMRKYSRAGSPIYFDGMDASTLSMEAAPRKDECESHFAYGTPIEASLSAQDTVGDVLAWISAYFGQEDASIILDHEVITAVGSEMQDRVYDGLYIPKPHLSGRLKSMFQFDSADTVRIMPGATLTVLDKRFPHPEMTLAQLGVPPLHILQVSIAGDPVFVELTGDERFWRMETL